MNNIQISCHCFIIKVLIIELKRLIKVFVALDFVVEITRNCGQKLAATTKALTIFQLEFCIKIRALNFCLNYLKSFKNWYFDWLPKMCLHKALNIKTFFSVDTLYGG